jgi:hypothetical protein
MTDTSNTNPKQWMEDVNETLDILSDQTTQLQAKVKQSLMVGGAALGLSGVVGLGLATLFKGQKAIVDTLQAVVERLEPAPMSPEDVARAQALLHPNVVVDNHKAPVAETKIMTNTEVPSETAEPVAAPASGTSTDDLPFPLPVVDDVDSDLQ